MPDWWKRLTQTHTAVHDLPTQTAQRLDAERACERAGLRLLLLTWLVLRGLTDLCAQGGRTGWLLALADCIPGLLLALLLRGLMALAHAPTLEELLRLALGRVGALLGRLWRALALLLLAETALCSLCLLFSEGVETGADLRWVAVVALLCALLCGSRRGLSRSVWLLRFVLLAVLAFLLADLGSLWRTDLLFPLALPENAAPVLWRNTGLAWPAVLFLSLPPRSGKPKRRGLGPVPAAALGIGILLLVCAALPQDILTSSLSVADALLLPAAFLSPVGRELAVVLWAAALLLLTALPLWGAAEAVDAPRWLPCILAALLLLPILLGLRETWQWAARLQAWVLLPPAVLAVLCIPGAVRAGRRKP